MRMDQVSSHLPVKVYLLKHSVRVFTVLKTWQLISTYVYHALEITLLAIVHVCYIHVHVCYITDGPRELSVFRSGDGLVCSALCNPQCSFTWINTADGSEVGTGRHFTPNRTHAISDVECLVSNVVGEAIVSEGHEQRSK